MGESLDIPGRKAVRSPMQWAPGPGGGFTTASPDSLRRPFPTGAYGPDKVSVAAQLDRPGSMHTWTRQLIRRRRALPEIGLGSHTLVDVGSPEVLGLRYEWAGRDLLTLHNFADHPVEVEIGDFLGKGPHVDLWSDSDYESEGPRFDISAHGYRWIRIGSDRLFL